MQGLLVKRNVQRKNVLQVLKYDTVLNLSSQNEMIQEKKNMIGKKRCCQTTHTDTGVTITKIT